MSVVWKYVLEESNDWTTLYMPSGAEILTAGSQGDSIVLWAKVNPESQLERRDFCIVGTGYTIPKGESKYIGTAKLMNDRLIIHVFERVL